MRWIDFDIATYHVRRQLGLSTLAAWKLLHEACEKDEVATKQDEDVLLVLDVDLEEWLKAKQGRAADSEHPRNVEIIKRLKVGDQPPKNIQWKVFCENIRKGCGVSLTDRGFSDERIEEVTKKLMSVNRRSPT
jgi:hypothetical protein